MTVQAMKDIPVTIIVAIEVVAMVAEVEAEAEEIYVIEVAEM